MNKRPVDTDAYEPACTRVCGTDMLPAWAPSPNTRWRPLDDADLPAEKRASIADPAGAREFSLDDVRRVVAARLEALESTMRLEYDQHLSAVLVQQYNVFTQWSAAEQLPPDVAGGMNYFC